MLFFFGVSSGFSLITKGSYDTASTLNGDAVYGRQFRVGTLQVTQGSPDLSIFLALKAAGQLLVKAGYLQPLRQLEADGWQKKAYLSENRAARASKLSASPLVSEQATKWENYLWYVVMTALAMICVLAFVLFENNRNKQKVNQLLQLQFEEIQLQKARIEAQKASIEEKNRNLELLNATKDKFFSIIAHDLKGPLNTLISFSNLLANDPALMSPQEIKVIAQELNKSVKNTSRLTENLLTWARSQMDNLGFYPVSTSLNKLVEDNIGLFQTMAHQKGITLKADLATDATIYADESHIRFVLRNLISNALKFTKVGGTVEISIQLTDTMVEVAVSDNGLGISEEIIDKLFRIDAKHTTLGTAGEKGTGLGLVLCKEFVEKNGGQLHIRSQAGKGSTFSFYVQAANQAKLAVSQGQSVPEQ